MNYSPSLTTGSEERRLFIAWHPASIIAVIRWKDAAGLDEWHGRQWQLFPASPFIEELTALFDLHNCKVTALELAGMLAQPTLHLPVNGRPIAPVAPVLLCGPLRYADAADLEELRAMRRQYQTLFGAGGPADFFGCDAPLVPRLIAVRDRLSDFYENRIALERAGVAALRAEMRACSTLELTPALVAHVALLFEWWRKIRSVIYMLTGQRDEDGGIAYGDGWCWGPERMQPVVAAVRERNARRPRVTYGPSSIYWA